MAEGGWFGGGQATQRRSAPQLSAPLQQARDQSNYNLGAALNTRNLNQYAQTDVFGNTLDYGQVGDVHIVNPVTGQTSLAPKFGVTQTLNPRDQALLEAQYRQRQGGVGLYDIASGQHANLFANTAGAGVPQRFNLATPHIFDAVTQPLQDYSTQFSSSAGPLTTNLGLSSGLSATRVSPSDNLVFDIAGGGPRTRHVAGAGEGVQGSISGAGQGIRHGGVSGAGEGIQGSITGANEGLVRSLGSANQGITRSYGDPEGYAQQRERVEQAFRDRFNPQLDRARANLEDRLASQGIRIGSDAYSDAISDFGRQANDADLQAILHGGQEQSRLAGLDRNRAIFENQAQAQGFGQELAAGQFANQAQAQGFGQNLAAGQFANQAQAQGFGQRATDLSLSNQAQAQGFGQNLAAGQFTNQAQAQAFGQHYSNAQLNNQAANAQFQENLGIGQFRNQAAGQEFGQRLSSENQFFANSLAAQDANNQARLQEAQFANQAAAQQHAQDLAAFNAQNRAATGRFDINEQLRQAANTDRTSSLSEALGLRNQALSEAGALQSLSAPLSSSVGQVATPQVATQAADLGGLIGQEAQINAATKARRQRLLETAIHAVGNIGSAAAGG